MQHFHVWIVMKISSVQKYIHSVISVSVLDSKAS